LLSLAGFVFPIIEPLMVPATVFVGVVCGVIFLRMLLSQFYREGIDLANLALEGKKPRSGILKRINGQQWGLFGKRNGPSARAWLRAVLFVGVGPANLVQHYSGGKAA